MLIDDGDHEQAKSDMIEECWEQLKRKDMRWGVPREILESWVFFCEGYYWSRLRG